MVLATELVSSFARSRGPVRGFVVRMLLGLLSAVYRSGEPLILRLTGAGTPSPPAERG